MLTQYHIYLLRLVVIWAQRHLKKIYIFLHPSPTFYDFDVLFYIFMFILLLFIVIIITFKTNFLIHVLTYLNDLLSNCDFPFL